MGWFLKLHGVDFGFALVVDEGVVVLHVRGEPGAFVDLAFEGEAEGQVVQVAGAGSDSTG